MEQSTIDTIRLEKINRTLASASNQASLLAINTEIIAERLGVQEGVGVIAKELQTLAEQLKLAEEELANIIDEQKT